MQIRSRAAKYDGECSSVRKDRKFWKFLWFMSVQPKVKSSLWRVCLGILPTHELLKAYEGRRGLSLLPQCSGICSSFFVVMSSVQWCMVRDRPEDVEMGSLYSQFLQSYGAYSGKTIVWGSWVIFLRRLFNMGPKKQVHKRIAANHVAVVQRAKNLLKGYKDLLPAQRHIWCRTDIIDFPWIERPPQVNMQCEKA